MKTEMPRNNEQDSLQAKELQKFFNKVKGVMLIPKGSKLRLLDYPVLCLVLSKETFINFKDYEINKFIIDLLDDKLNYESPEVQKLLLEYKNSLCLPSGQKGKK